MNAREKLEAALEQAVDFLAYQATSGMTLGTQVAAAAALVQAGADIGLLDKTEAPKGNAGPLTDAELFGVDLSAEGKAYANPKPNERMDAAAEAAKSMGAAREEMMQFVVKDEVAGPLPPPKLPWRPIAELPERPDVSMVFALWISHEPDIGSPDPEMIVRFGRFGIDAWSSWNNRVKVSHYTHFLELTPP